MVGIVVILTVVLSAVLLAWDTKRRTGRICVWRVIIAVAITFFGTGSTLGQRHQYDIETFLAMYIGMMTGLWYMFIQPRRRVDDLFLQGSSFLKHGNVQAAYAILTEALALAKPEKKKGPVLYNLAVCNIRLGQKELAIKALVDAVSARPSLRSRIAKDKDFAALRGDEQFRVLIANPKPSG